MAEKLPGIIDNRSSNKVLHAFQKLLPSLQIIDFATGMFERSISTFRKSLVWPWQGSDSNVVR